MTERYGWDTEPTPDLGIDPTKASAKMQTLADFVQGKVWGKDVASAYKQGLLQSGIESRAALDKATSSLDKATSAKAQVDAIVISGDSSLEAAQARVDTNHYTHPTLKARLDTEHQDITAQLAQTDQRVSETIANAGDGTIPTEVVDMRTVNGNTYTVAGDALRDISSGNAIKKGAITPDKTSFVNIETGINLFNKDSTENIPGKYISANGDFLNHEDYLLSHLIEVKPNKTYSTKISEGVIGYSLLYSDDMTPTVVNRVVRVTTNSDTRYIRVHMLKTQVEGVMVYEYDGLSLPYEPYVENYSIDNLITKKLETDDILDGAITKEKTDFILTSSNLFDKSTVIEGKYLTNNGEITDYDGRTVSDYIPVNAGKIYTFKHNPWGGVWYTASKTYISGNTANPMTAPPNASFFRMGVNKVNVDTQQMNEGDTLLPYEPFYIELAQDFKISSDNVRDNSLPITKMDFYKLVSGKNKFNKDDPDTLIGKFISVNESDGVWAAGIGSNDDYVLSHYIEVEENVSYKNTSSSSFRTNAFFDENFVCIGRTSSNVFTTPPNTKYIRVNLSATELDTAMVHVNDGTVSDYVPYTGKYQLSEDITISEKNMPVEKDANDLHNYKRIYSISDAITEWKKGNKFPVAFMGDSTTDGAQTTGNINNTVDTIGTDHIEPNAYPYLLEQKLKAYTGNDDLRIYNAGFSGWNTSSALNNFAQIFSESSAYGDVKMVGFVYGINDRPQDLEVIKNNLIKLCVASYRKGIQPFIVTPQIILQGSSDFTYVHTATRLVTDVVRLLKDFARTYNLELIDMNKATTNFIANAEIPISSILPDTLHFGDEGHKFEAGFLYSQFIGDTIEVTDDMEVSVTNPYTHYITSRAGFFTEPETFRRYANFNNRESDDLYVRAEILNSTNRKLILTLDASANSNFYFMVDGVKKLPTDLIELEIGHHRVEVYAGVGTTGRYYGFKLTKKV